MAKKRLVNVDLSDVESGGGSRVSEGDHKVKVKEVTEEEGEKSGEPYLKWVLKVVEGNEEKDNGKVLYHNTTLQPQGLFNLRRTLEAAGIEIPDSAMDIDLDELEDLEFMVTTEDDEYDGKTKSKIIDCFSADGKEEKEDEDEKPKKSSKKEEKEDDDEKPAKKSGPSKKASKKDEAEWEVGQRVSFEADGDTLTGKIVDVDSDEAKATVKVKGEDWTCDFADLTLVE